jgi:hypothetical protein
MRSLWLLTEDDLGAAHAEPLIRIIVDGLRRGSAQ